MACYGGTDVMERSCAVARGKDINTLFLHIFPHLAFRETFPTWKHLFTEPPSTVTVPGTGTVAYSTMQHHTVTVQ